jgi:hypothetical protein
MRYVLTGLLPAVLWASLRCAKPGVQSHDEQFLPLLGQPGTICQRLKTLISIRTRPANPIWCAQDERGGIGSMTTDPRVTATGGRKATTPSHTITARGGMLYDFHHHDAKSGYSH